MSEVTTSSTPVDPTLEQSPDLRGYDDALHTSQTSPEEVRAVYGGWLERRGIDPAGTPHLTMGRQEFDLFRNAPSGYQRYAREIYGIPGGDQDECQYALVDIKPEGDSSLHDPQLMIVTEADFGTTVDYSVIAEDFQDSDPDPRNPLTPDSHGALKTVDIANTLAASGQGLQKFASTLMSGETNDPLSAYDGDIGVRAGGIAPGQNDAYIWTISPFTKSVELTIAFPGQYDSVCVVRGQQREAANGKPGMAQIDHPTEVFKIEGEDLRELQNIYVGLYHEPDFALTDSQRQERDELFNGYLSRLISHEVSNNNAQEQARRDEYRRPQPLRARERPLP